MIFETTRRKKIVVLTNQIFYIELTKIFCIPNKFSILPTNLFVEPTKGFVIAFCLINLFVKRTKILLRRQKKVCQFYIFLRAKVVYLRPFLSSLTLPKFWKQTFMYFRHKHMETLNQSNLLISSMFM